MAAGFLVSAGFDGALHVIAMLELLRRQGHLTAGILVVSPWNPARVRALTRQRGLQGLVSAARRLLGGRQKTTDEPVVRPLVEFLEQHRIHDRSIKRWAYKHGVPYYPVRNINDSDTVGLVLRLQSDGLLYGGGGILHESIIEALRGKILNAHSGPLPEVRGMNACEWSLLLGLDPAVTIHFINRGIDTGASVDTITIDREPGDTVEHLREKCVVAGVQGMVSNIDALMQPVPVSHQDAVVHRQCYVLAPALFELLQFRLLQQNAESS